MAYISSSWGCWWAASTAGTEWVAASDEVRPRTLWVARTAAQEAAAQVAAKSRVVLVPRREARGPARI
jgi:hypothetical protein